MFSYLKLSLGHNFNYGWPILHVYLLQQAIIVEEATLTVREVGKLLLEEVVDTLDFPWYYRFLVLVDIIHEIR